ncbi:hypothetical protein [Bacillus tropicus]|uniref:hypothetical protein n=1 Tax=Bacillus tropicus TaxID=2026188 RepID=UPI0037F37136
MSEQIYNVLLETLDDEFATVLKLKISFRETEMVPLTGSHLSANVSYEIECKLLSFSRGSEPFRCCSFILFFRDTTTSLNTLSSRDKEIGENNTGKATEVDAA